MTTKQLLKTILFSSTLGFTSLFAANISYTGTDFLSGNIEKQLSIEIEKIEKVAPKSSLKGSLLGEKSLQKGDCDFSFLMFIDIKKVNEIQKGDWIAVPIAYHVAYVLTPTANQLEQISFKDLIAIYAQATQYHYSTWKELPKSNLDTAIVPAIGNPADSNAIPFFEYSVLPKGIMLPGVRTFSKNNDLMNFLKNTGNSIAISNVPPPFDIPAKSLAVSAIRNDKTKSAAYLPTQINIYNNDYPLSIPIYLVYPKKNEASIKKLYPAIFSKSVSDAIEKANYVSLPKNIRENLEKTIDKTK